MTRIERLIDTWRDDFAEGTPFCALLLELVWFQDFSIDRGRLLFEGKYIQGNTTPSKVTEGMAADLTKDPQKAHILFVVYDPDAAIVDRARLKRDFEDRGRCTVRVLP